MHPNAFLKTYWRLELRPQIFVAMGFSPAYDQRFMTVIKPAIDIRPNQWEATCRFPRGQLQDW